MESLKKVFWEEQPYDAFFILPDGSVVEAIQSKDQENYYIQSDKQVSVQYLVLTLENNAINQTKIEDFNTTDDEFAKRIAQTLNLRTLEVYTFQETLGVFIANHLFTKPSPKGGGLQNMFFGPGDLVYTVKRVYKKYKTADMDYKTYLFKYNLAKINFKVHYEKNNRFVRRYGTVYVYNLIFYRVLDVQFTTIAQQVSQQVQVQQTQPQEEEDIRLQKLKEKFSSQS